MDRGWVLNRARDRWELLGPDGEPTGYGLSGRFLAVYGPAGPNRELAARGLPPLDPSGPWWHLMMVGGPLDGLHHWADPAACDDGPPGRVALAWAARVLLVDPPDQVATLTRATYRRAGAWCGHRGCPVAYVEDQGRDHDGGL